MADVECDALMEPRAFGLELIKHHMRRGYPFALFPNMIVAQAVQDFISEHHCWINGRADILATPTWLDPNAPHLLPIIAALGPWQRVALDDAVFARPVSDNDLSAA